MKKVSISILLVLPFILIFFISVLGKAIQKYGRVAAEYVALFIENERQENGYLLKYDIDELGTDPIPVDIRVMPEFANNRTFTVYNTNPDFSTITVDESGEEPKAYINLIDRGISKYTITSNENPSLQCSFTVSVERGVLRSMNFFDIRNPSKTFDEYNLPLGKTRELGVEFHPDTTRAEFRELIWTFDGKPYEDVDEFYPVKFNPANNSFEGVNVGTANILVTSKNKPEISASLTIHVSTNSIEDAYFNYFSNKAFKVVDKFDFKDEGGLKDEGKILFNNLSLSYGDVKLKATGGDVNSIEIEKLNDLTIEFTELFDSEHANETRHIVELSLYMKETHTFLDQITIRNF